MSPPDPTNMPAIFPSYSQDRFRSTSTSSRTCSRLCRKRNVWRRWSAISRPFCPACGGRQRRAGTNSSREGNGERYHRGHRGTQRRNHRGKRRTVSPVYLCAPCGKDLRRRPSTVVSCNQAAELRRASKYLFFRPTHLTKQQPVRQYNPHKAVSFGGSHHEFRPDSRRVAPKSFHCTASRLAARER